MAHPLASRPGSRLPADRLNPRPEIIPDQGQPARQPDDVLPGTVPIHGPAWHHQKRTGPSRVGLYTCKGYRLSWIHHEAGVPRGCMVIPGWSLGWRREAHWGRPARAGPR
jgi:hypothetical protein